MNLVVLEYASERAITFFISLMVTVRNNCVKKSQTLHTCKQKYIAENHVKAQKTKARDKHGEVFHISTSNCCARPRAEVIIAVHNYL